jgi:DNA polymerase elongation subunit (family B)
MIEQAVINEAHLKELVVPDRIRSDGNEGESNEGQKAAGAYVATPKGGIHEYVGAVDITSLYPSIIRSLNFAPETIVGQVRQDLTDNYMSEKIRELSKNKRKLSDDDTDVSGGILWEGLFGALEYEKIMQRTDDIFTIDFEDGRKETLTANQIYSLIFEGKNRWLLSANGTIFSYENEGIIPGLLTKWFSERKDIQKQAKEIDKIISGLTISDELVKLING